MPPSPGTVREVDYSSNPALSSLPDHLKQFVVEQNYDQYTPVDHAVWRFIMRQNIYFLREHAHKVYFDGLLNTGISPDRIPRIEEMSEILGRIGWGAVAVDGFIPPAAFMEFQAYKVLVIAADMRQVEHIEYTPAPDIVHEAAGHAPIIVDEEYAAYLQRFGEIGAKAMSSQQDFELYKAIRHLSILKEAPHVEAHLIAKAEKQVAYWQENLGEPSEMAQLSRLHWWTVEYGLIGKLHAPRIYGAGLLSSIGEAASCLEDDVTKVYYNINARDVPFDITTKQPQLFVTPDFQHLNNVLEEFASTMAFRVGGLKGIQKAIQCENTVTCVYSSGLQVSGVCTEVLTDEHDRPVYLKLTGPSALAFENKQLPGHGKEYHKDGFGAPVGKFMGCPRAPESLDDSALSELGIEPGKRGTLRYESGITVEGVLEHVHRRNSRIIVITFSDCTVRRGERVLFQPGWGKYDMAVGESIVSVFNGAADKDAYEQIALVPRERTIKVNYSDKTRQLHSLYQNVRDIRGNSAEYDHLEKIWNEQQRLYPDDWLLSMEIYEILATEELFPDLRERIRTCLESRHDSDKNLETLIQWGFRLTDYNLPV